MSYRYQGNSHSPWASGAPPQSAYGGPPMPPQHHQQHPQHHAYGAPAYGTPQMTQNTYAYGRQMGPAQAMTPPVPPQWSHNQGHIGGPPMISNQRGNMRPMSGPTGKRGGGNWHDNVPNKRMNRGNRNQGNWQGNRRDGRKFDNRNNFAKDNRRNQQNRQKAGDQIERRQQHDQAQKAAESLEKKEYAVVATGEATKDDEKNKGEDIDPAQARYVLAVFGYCCKLCDVFLRDKGASLEHCQNETHVEKFNAAEEERIAKEKEEAAEEKNVDEEKVKSEENDTTKDADPKEDDKEVKEETDNTMNGVDDSKHEEETESKTELGKDEQCNDEQVDTAIKSEELVDEANNDVKVENKEDELNETVTDDVQQPNDNSEVGDDEMADETGDANTTNDTIPKSQNNSPRGGMRGGFQRGRGPGRGGGGRGRGNRGRGGARGRR